MKFEDKIRYLVELSKRRGEDQADIAMLCDVSTKTVYNWENGLTRPQSKKVYQALAERFGCSAEWLENDDLDFSAIKGTAQGQARKIIQMTEELMTGGGLSEKEKINFIDQIMRIYLNT
ncbi:MAG: helix-turn-helix domain-containing protein [Lachnospiraceae bacterium]|nr:helix-turn-helix domain-containing protein [Lachnospiraceae bacterium]